VTPAPAPESFAVHVHTESSHVRVAPVGELDIATAEQLAQHLREIRADGADRILLDLRELTFLDSSGLRTIIALDAEARRDGLELGLVQGPPAVERVFAITGLLGHLPFREP
jgi:anti-sigma B factor antagonist